MSFADGHSKRDGGGRPRSGASSSTASALSQLGSCVTNIHTNTQTLRALLKSNASQDARREVSELRTRTAELVARGAQLLGEISRVRSSTSREDFTTTKLARDFNDVAVEYRDAVRTCTQWERDSVASSPWNKGGSRKPASTIDVAQEPKETTSLLVNEGNQGLQSQLLIQEEEAYKRAAQERALISNNQFMAERRTAMEGVQRALQDVNVIFKDLAVLVADQGDQLDIVEANVADTGNNLVKGKKEIRHREASLVARRKFFFIALVTVAFIIVIVLLILLN